MWLETRVMQVCIFRQKNYDSIVRGLMVVVGWLQFSFFFILLFLFFYFLKIDLQGQDFLGVARYPLLKVIFSCEK
jgi:hypothetical protein